MDEGQAGAPWVLRIGIFHDFVTHGAQKVMRFLPSACALQGPRNGVARAIPQRGPACPLFNALLASRYGSRTRGIAFLGEVALHHVKAHLASNGTARFDRQVL